MSRASLADHKPIRETFHKYRVLGDPPAFPDASHSAIIHPASGLLKLRPRSRIAKTISRPKGWITSYPRYRALS